jgi:predicted metal-dependent HD superfamily phosphohydrolase
MADSPTESMQARLLQQTQKLRALPVVEGIFATLRQGLSADLYYHNVSHSEDVLQTALELGVRDDLSDRQLELLAVAAAYHDAGYLIQKDDNEPIGASMAREALTTAGGYSPEEINLVAQMIEDTRLQRQGERLVSIPSTALSKYLLDADLSNLGRDIFWESNQRLQRETNIDSATFRTLTEHVFLGHSWLTPAAQLLFSHRQKENFEQFLACKLV